MLTRHELVLGARLPPIADEGRDAPSWATPRRGMAWSKSSCRASATSWPCRTTHPVGGGLGKIVLDVARRRLVAGSLLWAAVADGARLDRFDLLGAAICLVGVGVGLIMYAAR